jgi:hypothetical protein
MSVRSNGGDECTANRDQHFAGHIVGLCLALKNLLAVSDEGVSALQQAAQRLGAGDDDGGMFLKEGKESGLPGHKRLKPAKHHCLSLA